MEAVWDKWLEEVASADMPEIPSPSINKPHSENEKITSIHGNDKDKKDTHTILINAIDDHKVSPIKKMDRIPQKQNRPSTIGIFSSFFLLNYV